MMTEESRIAVWEVQNEFYEGWQMYTPEFCDVLERAFHQHKTQPRSKTLHGLSHDRAFNFTDWVEVDRLTGREYPIRRLELSADSPLAQGVVWKWINDHGKFKPYCAEAVNYIEKHYSAAPKKRLNLSELNLDLNYTLDFKTLLQINNKTHFERSIARDTLRFKLPLARIRLNSTNRLSCDVVSSSKTSERESNGMTSNKSDSYKLAPGSVPSAIRRFADCVTEVPNEDCCICMGALHEECAYEQNSGAKSATCHAVQLNRCKHRFHTLCLKAAFDSSSSKESLMCPYCKTIYGTKTGNQPPGHMSVRTIYSSLPGFRCNTIEITYDIRSGTQGPEHPNPGQYYSAPAFPRIAYLPNNKEGQKADVSQAHAPIDMVATILKMLRVAWDRRLIFTIGRSVTSGSNNVVTWNEIHHKTNKYPGGSHGFPDPNYFTNVVEELKAQGVTQDDIK